MTRLRLLLVLATLLVAPMAFAGTYTLSDWCFYVNSLDINQSCNAGGGLDNVPVAAAGVTDLLHLQTDNTGTLTVTLAPGNYNVFAIFNYNIDGGTNEYANAIGSLAVNQVYSVNNQSNLVGQGVGGSLDGVNGCTSGCSDTAVALGYTNVIVPAGSTGTITFTAGTTPPPSGAYIQQTNPGTNNSLDFSSNIQIDGGLNTQSAIPEPGSIGLMGGGLGALLWAIRRRRKA